MAQKQQHYTYFFIVALVVSVLIIVGCAIVYAWDIYATRSLRNDALTGNPATEPFEATQYKTYASTTGGLKLTYPADWLLTGLKGGAETTSLDGTETSVRFQTKPQADKKDNFGVIVTFGSVTPPKSPQEVYTNGMTTALPHNLAIWEESRPASGPVGPPEHKCPVVRLAQNGAFGARLPNGALMDVYATYCWAPGMTTDFDYPQQKSSGPYEETLKMLRNITFN